MFHSGSGATSGATQLLRASSDPRALGRDAEYLEALPDLEAGLDWAKRNGSAGRAAASGSSYSSALAFLLAARHPGDLSAILAFSPGEYPGKPRLVRDAASRLTLPIYVTSASSRGEIGAAREILAAAASNTKRQFEAKKGVHGSSTLRADANPAGTESNWAAGLEFLGGVFPAGR